MIKINLAFRDVSEIKEFNDSQEALAFVKGHEDKTILIDGLNMADVTETALLNADDILITIMPLGG